MELTALDLLVVDKRTVTDAHVFQKDGFVSLQELAGTDFNLCMTAADSIVLNQNIAIRCSANDYCRLLK